MRDFPSGFRRCITLRGMFLTMITALAPWCAPGVRAAETVSFSQSAASIEAYDFVEVTLKVSSPAARNPFTDVVVSGQFSPEGGTALPVTGFCDAADGSTMIGRNRKRTIAASTTARSPTSVTRWPRVSGASGRRYWKNAAAPMAAARSFRAARPAPVQHRPHFLQRTGPAGVEIVPQKGGPPRAQVSVIAHQSHAQGHQPGRHLEWSAPDQ